MDQTDNAVLARVLKKVLTPEQIHEVLEAITSEIVNGYCPLCDREEIPVDKDGNEIEGMDVSNAEWRELHDDNCLVTWLENTEQSSID